MLHFLYKKVQKKGHNCEVTGSYLFITPGPLLRDFSALE